MPLFFQLERFRMLWEFYCSNDFALRRADDSDSSSAKAHVNPLRCIVVTDIVGIVFEIYFSNRLVRFCVVYLANAAFVIGNKETIKFRDVGDSLRRAETGNG